MMTSEEFKAIIIPLQGVMFGIARKCGFDIDSSRDIVQEAMSRLWRARDRLEKATNRKAYCLQTVRNECMEEYKRLRNTISLDNLDVDEYDSLKIEDNLDMERVIKNIMEKLPANQKKVLSLSIAGFENREISDTTGLTEINIRQLLSRGRRVIKEKIKGLI